jgi:hypothetical protein
MKSNVFPKSKIQNQQSSIVNQPTPRGTLTARIEKNVTSPLDQIPPVAGASGS